MLDGLLSPGTIRDMIVRGQVPGAVRASRRYFLPRKVVGELVVDMSAGSAAPETNGVQHMPPRPQASTFDAPARWATG